jgi:hypothetical protein
MGAEQSFEVGAREAAELYIGRRFDEDGVIDRKRPPDEFRRKLQTHDLCSTIGERPRQTNDTRDDIGDKRGLLIGIEKRRSNRYFSPSREPIELRKRIGRQRPAQGDIANGACPTLVR